MSRYLAVVDTFAVSACLPRIVSDKGPNSARDQVRDQHQSSIAVSEAFGHIAVVVVLVGRYAEEKDTAFDQDALVAEDNLVAVATELDQVAVALVLDDIHLPYLRHLSSLGVVKDIHLAVVEGAFAASHH